LLIKVTIVSKDMCVVTKFYFK